jgi:ATP-dependent protease HslVU (ClpYQ) ATPase subunit
MEELQDAMQSIGSIFGNGKGHNRKLTVKRAREIFTEEETEKAVDTDRAIDEAKERVEQMGIVFIDEIDKVAVKECSETFFPSLKEPVSPRSGGLLIQPISCSSQAEPSMFQSPAT